MIFAKRAALAVTLASTAAALASTPASAQQFNAEANVARSEGQWGGELGVGMPVINDGPIQVTPLVGVFVYDRDHPRYEKDDGVCYAGSSDVEVADHHCNGTGVRLYGKVEATYRLPASVAVGVGARWMGDNVRPYGTVSVPLAPLLDVKGDLGSHYLSAGITAHF